MIDEATQRAFLAAASGDDEGDLPRAALLVARVEHAGLDPEPWLSQLAALGEAAAARVERLGRDAGLQARVDALNELLFVEHGFTGNETTYEDPRNSFLNEVLARRTGIPISLSVVFLEVARLAGLPAEGVNFPGHFLVRCRATGAHQGQPRELLVDPFHGGTVLGEADCRRLLRRHMGDEATFDRRLLATADKRAILVRMLVNLKRVYVAMRSFPQARDIVGLLVALDPHDASELRDRGLLSYHVGDHVAALRDLEAYLQAVSRAGAARDEDDEEARREYRQVWEHVKTLRRRIAGFN